MSTLRQYTFPHDGSDDIVFAVKLIEPISTPKRGPPHQPSGVSSLLKTAGEPGVPCGTAYDARCRYVWATAKGNNLSRIKKRHV
jgi:hypothetical protein